MITQLAPPIQSTYHPHLPIPGITFRLAQHQDLETLQKNCYPDAIWSQFQDHFEYLLKWQEDGRCSILIAETTNHPEIIGSGQLIRQMDKAEIAELSVRQDFQNRGIGMAAIHILTQIATEQQLDLLEIGAAIENEKALRLYRRLGFNNERRLLLPNSEEAIILSKPLTPEKT